MKFDLAIVGIFIAMLLSGGIVSAEDSEQNSLDLTFGIYQSDKATVMYKKFTPVIDAIQEELERTLKRPTDINIKIFKTYDEGLEAIVNGTVDFVRFGPASYILSKKRNPKVQLLAMELNKGKKRFKGMIVVPADSPLKSVADLKGQKFAFGAKNSTIGRYLVQALMVEAGVHEKDLASFKYLGRHDKVAKAVQLKDFDAGSIKEKTFKKFSKNGSIRLLQDFDNVTKPWIARENLDPKVFVALRDALIHLKSPEALKKLKISGFSATSDSEYQFARKGMKLSEKF